MVPFPSETQVELESCHLYFHHQREGNYMESARSRLRGSRQAPRSPTRNGPSVAFRDRRNVEDLPFFFLGLGHANYFFIFTNFSKESAHLAE